MITFQHLAPHARGKIKADNIFRVGAMANAAKRQFGRDNVIDASLGALLEDDGKLALIEAVEEASKRLPPEQIARYAPIGGLPSYREDVLQYLFGHVTDPQPMGAVATAGATGALFLSVWNLLSMGDILITHDYFWSPYEAIARNAIRKLSLFKTFCDDGSFNVAGALEQVECSLDLQNRALLIINNPCHNPTGFCITTQEAKRLRDGLCDIASKYPHCPVTLLIDGAYWEFEDPQVNRDFVGLFQDLPENLLFALAYSISKSMTRYGFRTGALAVSSSSQETVDELIGTFTSSIRATWSNTPRIGQALFSAIFRDAGLKKQLLAEQYRLANLCNRRGNQFVMEAKAIGLPLTPYKRGFFTVIPTNDSKTVADRLAKEHIYVVPMTRGIRVAFCAMSSDQVPGLAARLRPYF